MATHLLKRLQATAVPLLFFAVAAYGALLVFLEVITFRLAPKDVTDRRTLNDRIFAKLWLTIAPLLYAKELETAVPGLVAQASGIVLELGPGSGNQLSRYDKARVRKIYGIEPNVELHDALRKTIKEQGLSDIYTIVPCGVEAAATLEKYGIKAESVDSIVSVQVLCSVPRPEDMVKGLYHLLKPGGQFIVYEHVKSDDTFSSFVQRLYNIIWPRVFNNCHLDRPTAQYLQRAGSWSKLEIGAPQDEGAWAVIPHVYGRLVK